MHALPNHTVFDPLSQKHSKLPFHLRYSEQVFWLVLSSHITVNSMIKLTPPALNPKPGEKPSSNGSEGRSFRELRLTRSNFHIPSGLTPLTFIWTKHTPRELS